MCSMGLLAVSCPLNGARAKNLRMLVSKKLVKGN